MISSSGIDTWKKLWRQDIKRYKHRQQAGISVHHNTENSAKRSIDETVLKITTAF
jgi:hypothetical protein